MSQDRYWCWELAKLGSGPDYFCILEFTSESTIYLEELISSRSFPGYKYIFVHSQRYCDHHKKICNYHLFVDQDHAQAIFANIQGTNPQNIWIYNAIEYHENLLVIECGYGGVDDHTNETSLLIELCDHPQIKIESWRIFSGGQGYNDKIVKEGKFAAELKQYIRSNS